MLRYRHCNYPPSSTSRNRARLSCTARPRVPDAASQEVAAESWPVNLAGHHGDFDSKQTCMVESGEETRRGLAIPRHLKKAGRRKTVVPPPLLLSSNIIRIDKLLDIATLVQDCRS